VLALGEETEVATIKDVAQVSGVTAATVSNVIRNRNVVSKATRERVLEAIEALNYRPNLLARSLVRGCSYTLALTLPDITNPFYPEIALEAERRCRELGYQIILCNTHFDTIVARNQLTRLSGGLVDGAIVLSGGIKPIDVVDLSLRGVPVVACLFGSEFDGVPDAGKVSRLEVDFERAGVLAAEHLLELGHRSFAAIMKIGLDGRGGHEPRLHGFRKRLTDAGISLPDQMVRIAETNVESGRQAFQEVLRSPKRPSALFAGNDLMALGAMEFALDNGLRVPEDISIVGIDDIDLSRHVRPALTTIALPKRNLAETAVELLVDKLTTPREKPNVSILQPFLVRRQSTCNLNPGTRKSQ